jgi:hypothetical protein
MKLLKENANMFKDNNGQIGTQRINQTDIKPTIDWLEQMIDLDLLDTVENNGDSSLGKLELCIDSTKLSPDQLVAELTQWCNSHDLKAREYIKNSGSKIYFKTPITGNPNNGYVQTNFSFVKSTETHNESEAHFLSRLRDRIVNQGMLKLIESNEVKINGGKTKNIEHIEDLVFRKGISGIKDALIHIKHLASDTKNSATVKWDGKPSIVFGRNQDGEFILTDVIGFKAKDHDQIRISKQAENQDNTTVIENRVEQLDPIYDMLWPMLEQAIPKNFKGYIQGDLLYTNTPKEESGAMVFKPNTIKYSIPINTKLGEEIADSYVGIAVHTFYKDYDSSKEPIGNIKFNSVPGLLLINPIRPKDNVKPKNNDLVKELRTLMKISGHSIDILFDPAELRQLEITDLPKLCIKFINEIIHQSNVTDFTADQLISKFGNWLKDNVRRKKYKNIVEYLQSPRSNEDGLSAAFVAFVLLHDIKMDLLQQLDRQHPGQEGWVIATPGGFVKFVNRFDFTRKKSY